MVKIKKFVHNTIQIKTSKIIIYIDPYKIDKNLDKADYILVSHEHYDHLSPEDIQKLTKDSTKLILPRSCINKVDKFFNSENVISFIKEEKIDFKDFKLSIVPAYNTDKKFHKQGTDWSGFVIEIDKKRIYYAGDTDLIPEMNLIYNIDLAILPVSGTYVMDAEEAANATSIIQPELAMPCHYGEIVGEQKDADFFKNKAHCDVVLDEAEL